MLTKPYTEWHILPLTNEITARNASAVQHVAASLAQEARSQNRLSFLVGATDLPATLPDALPLIEVNRTDFYQARRSLQLASQFFTGRNLLRSIHIRAEAEGPDIAYVHNQPWLGRDLARELPAACRVLYLHNVAMRRVGSASIRRALSYFDYVICVSDFIATDLLRRSKGYGSRSNLIVAPNAIDVSLYSSAGTSTVDILYLGRVTPGKGLHVLIDAVALLASEGLQPRVSVVGGQGLMPTQLLTAYERKVRSKASSALLKAEFLGPIPRDEVPSQLARAKILVVPSIEPEAASLAVLEGMASPAAVVASANGGIPELAARGGVALVPIGRARDLAVAIRELLEDDGHRMELAQAGRIAASRLTWSNTYSTISAAIHV